MIHVLEVAVTLELDKSGDVAYLRFTNLPAEDARRVRAALIEDRRGITYGALDLADEGNGPAVGLEILNASKRLPHEWLEAMES